MIGLLNAIEATTDAGGELTVRSALAQSGQLTGSVSDTGVGVFGRQAQAKTPRFSSRCRPAPRSGDRD
jgi:hypothetical protein